MNPVFEMKYPKQTSRRAWEPLRLWTSLFLENKPGIYEDGKQILDLENAVDYNLFNLLISGMDNIMKNIYFWIFFINHNNCNTFLRSMSPSSF